MKKYGLIVLTLIITVFIGSSNVNAVMVKTKFKGEQYNTGITWKALGNDSAGHGEYTDHEKAVTVNGQDYDAWCLDPGLKLNTGLDYNCSPISDSGILSIVSQSSSNTYTVVQLALRFYAAMKGYGSSELREMKAAVIRFHQIKSGLGSIMAAGCLAGGGTECSISEYDYLSGNQDVVDAAYGMALSALTSNVTASNSSGGLTFTKTTESTEELMVYNVTSLQNISKIKFVCDGCTIQEGEDSFSGRSGVLKVVPAPDCQPFKIKAYYVPDGVHICNYANSSVTMNYQYLIANFDASAYEDTEIDTTGEPIFTHQDQGIGCTGECCEEGTTIDPNYIVGDIHNCCYENTHSWAREYNLNDLFCNSTDLGVNYYWAKCNSESYQDIKMTGDLNEYCVIYCTERVTVDIPPATNGINGRYFELTKTTFGTKSPYVQGFKRCRTIINFKQWQIDYRKQVEDQIKYYKIYQENKLKQTVYEESIASSHSCDLKVNVTCKGETKTKSADWEENCSTDPTTGEKTGCVPKSCYEEVTTSAPGDFTASKDFTKNGYTEYRFGSSYSAHNGKSYYWVKLDPNGFDSTADGYYKYFKLINDNSASYTHRNWSIWETISTFDDAYAHKSAQEAVKKTKGSGTRCEVTAGVSCTLTIASDSCGNTSESSHHRAWQENVPSVKDTYKAAADSAMASFQAAAANAKELENKIDKCDNYFTSYEGTNAQANYPFNAQLFGFEYTQIYVDGYGDLKKDVTLVPFESTPGCVIFGPYLPPITDDEDGLVDTQYSTIYVDTDHITQTTDFKSMTLELDENTTDYQRFLDTQYDANQKFVQDAKYQAICSWNEPTNTKYTLVPKGIVTESSENVTKNNRQYQVYLTTLEGKFDTRWLLSGLGSSQNGGGKFDAYFAEHGSVCASGETAANTGLFHCGLEITWEVITTGKCTDGDSTIVDPENCPDPDGPIEPVLTFRIIDPKTIFTCSSFEDCGYAYNWFEGTNGQTTMEAIKSKAQADTTYSPESLSYVVTLNTKDMKEIKNYNRSREQNNYGGYSDFSLQCDCPDDVQECNASEGDHVCTRSSSCTKCRSVFLDGLYSGTLKYPGSSSNNVTAASGTLGTIRDSGVVHWAGI